MIWLISILDQGPYFFIISSIIYTMSQYTMRRQNKYDVV